MRFLRSINLPERLFLVVFALIMLNQLFVGPMVGLANSGDFSRLSGWFGIGYFDQADSQRLFVIKKFAWHPKVELHYPSSAVLAIGAALAANAATGRLHVFDIRFLGLVYLFAYLAAMYVLTRYGRTLPLVRRLLLYAITTLMFADIGYTAYFNSFFSEPASLIALVATVATALWITSAAQTAKPRLLLALFFLAALLFTTAKVQNVFLAVPLAFIGWRLSCLLANQLPKAARPLRNHGLIFGALLILLSAAEFGAYTVGSDIIRTTNLYNTVFKEILGNSSTPREDAVELGMDPAVAEYAGTTVYAPVPPEVKKHLLERVGSDDIVKFYLRHPDRLIDLSVRAGDQVFSQRPSYLGNFEMSYALRDGMPPVEPSMYLPEEYFSQEFAFWSALKEEAVPKALGTALVFVLLNLAVALFKRLKLDRTSAARVTSELHLTLIFMAVLQFLTVVVGEGEYELAKHLFLFNLLCEICLVFLVMYAAGAGAWLWSSKRKKIVPSPAAG